MAFTIMISVLWLLMVEVRAWEPPKSPECQSYNGLCDVTIDVIDPSSPTKDSSQTEPSTGSQMCQCPANKTCPSQPSDLDRVVNLISSSAGQTIKTRLSYCEPLKRNPRACRLGEVAVTLRGVGPIIVHVVGGVKCTCNGPLTLKKVKPSGIYSVQYFACGQRECRVNDSNPPVCERVKWTVGVTNGDIAMITKYPCACPTGYTCSVESHVKRGSSKRLKELTCNPSV